ncbi:DUF6461 domain-containing protein [Actinosynnema sp. CS-041913]|uniref:DUF6461 domain-containing protein n=1 Tax=Actinosynnema sp. CS-041913 TaxID=3239917 RepID=UPI003D91D364
MLPEPTTEVDAVDHYVALLADAGWPGETMCLTVVRGLPVAEALIRFNGEATDREVTLVDAGQASTAAFPDELPLVVADVLDGWVVLAEDNGWNGADLSVLARLSEGGTVAASAYWNVNLLAQVALAHDGEVVGAFDFVIDEPPAEGAMEPFIRGLDFTDAERMCAAALAFLERVSGVRVPVDWSTRPHPASVIGRFPWLNRSGATGWLTDMAPELHAGLSTASDAQVRAVTTLAATWACETTGVEDPAVLDTLARDVDTVPAAERAVLRERLAERTREEYRQALNLRWDHCRPLGLEKIAALQGEVSRRNADRSAEHGSVARTHAMVAARGRLMDDPRVGLGLAVANAYQIDKPGWPALRDRLTQAL